MQDKLQELTDRLYNEGLSKGKHDGEELVQKAQAEADRIVAYALSDAEPDLGNMRETVFMAWLKDLYPLTTSPISDFEMNGRTFELGGKKKGKKQIESATEGYVVKDDIEYAYQNIIPLWMFGFVY